jgi:HTH-type transcriptional regulator, sugar sensing transcriptional regulator
MIEKLIKIGLTEKEAQVYLAALELAEDSAQNIAKKAAVNRATTYVIMERLMALGLMSRIERGKKTLFIAEDPMELENILDEQRQAIEGRKKLLEDAMGQLRAIHNRNASKPVVRYFEGADGLEALDRYGWDQFPEGTEMTGIIPIDLIEEQFPARRKRGIEERVKRKIHSRMIYTHKDGELPPTLNEQELRTGVFLPRSQFPIDGTVQIYPGWGVKFFNFNKNHYFGVLVQNPDLARNLQEFFELAWEGAQHKKS